MSMTGDTIRTVGSAVAIAVAIVTLVWYVASLDGRVRSLEEKVHTLTIAPVIAGVAGKGSVTQNPIPQDCVELARDVVSCTAPPP
jgi:hypothetical protein